MEPKFKKLDAVRIKNAPWIWYTNLDDIRIKHIGDRGIIISVDSVTFTEESICSYNATRGQRMHVPHGWTETVFDYRILFPSSGDKICFSEIYLEKCA